MAAATFEGVIEDGQVHVADSVRLPDKTKVYIIIPDYKSEDAIHLPAPPPVVRVLSPRLPHREAAAQLVKTLVEDAEDAPV